MSLHFYHSESNSYFNQVSVKLVIWDSGNLTTWSSDNLRLGKLMFCGFDNLKFAVWFLEFGIWIWGLRFEVWSLKFESGNGLDATGAWRRGTSENATCGRRGGWCTMTIRRPVMGGFWKRHRSAPPQGTRRQRQNQRAIKLKFHQIWSM